jgi:WD40-like Beta Propeller Repeat
VRRVLTRDQLGRVLRARWLFPVVVLVLVLGSLVVTQRARPALAADTRGATEIVSVATNGAPSTNESFQPAISANGRFVAFTSFAALDPLDQGNDSSTHVDEDIYVRDTLAGHTSTTYLTRGHFLDEGDVLEEVASNGDSDSPSMSASGRYIGFRTTAQNITGSATTPTAVICDRGAADPTTGAFGSSCAYTVLGTSASDTGAELSGDGTRAAYIHNGNAVVVNLSLAANGAILTPGPGSFVSPPAPGTLTVNGIDLARISDFDVALSANGRYLVRVSEYADDSFDHDIEVVLLNDLNTPTAPAVRFDFATSATSFVGNENNFLEDLAISGDGRRIAFTEGLIAAGEPPRRVHAIDRDPDGNGVFGPAGGQPITADTVSRNVSGAIVGGIQPSFSTDGRYLAFATDAALVHGGFDDTTKEASCVHVPAPGAFVAPLGPEQTRHPGRMGMRLAADTGISNCDVVVRDLVQDAQRVAANLPRLPAELASPSEQRTCGTGGTLVCEGNGDSDQPALDADGSAVAFASFASDLVSTPGSDNNGHTDVFKRTFTPVPLVSPLNFGDVSLNSSATGTATVTYQGFGPLRISTITIGGPQGSDFDVFPGQTCTGQVLHPGDTCSVSVRFRPTALGTRNGTLILTTDTGVQGTGTLTGNGVPEPPPKTPGFQALPNPLDFGAHPLFNPLTPKSVTVTNTGTAPLTISAVTLIGSAPTNFPGDYQITANTCLAAAVAPAATCQVTLRFAPQAVGARPALLQFTDNATPGPQLVGLTGSGGAPTLVAKPPLAPPGAVSQVTGTGFPAGKVVVLTLDLMPGQVSVTAAADGTFTVPLVIFPHTQYGKRQLHATVQGVPTPIVVSIDFLVVPGSLQPPDFAERR